MKIIIQNLEVPSQRKLAKVANIMEHTLRMRVHELLAMVLENGWTLKQGVKVYP